MDDIQQAADLSLRGAIWATDGLDFEVLVPDEYFAFVAVDPTLCWDNGTPRTACSLAKGEYNFSVRGLGPGAFGRTEISPADIPPERLSALLRVLNYYPEETTDGTTHPD